VLRRRRRVVAIVAKLEKAEAIANLDAIIAEADAAIVARGRTTFSQLHLVCRAHDDRKTTLRVAAENPVPRRIWQCRSLL